MTRPTRPRSKPFVATEVDEVSAAIFDVLMAANGGPVAKADLIAKVAEAVPPHVGYRFRLKPGEGYAGDAYVRRVASGQRDFASNRVYVHLRNRNLTQQPGKHIVLNPAVLAAWRTYRGVS